MSDEATPMEQLNHKATKLQLACEPQYHKIRVTRSFPLNLHRIQAVYGRWMATGVGMSEEEAREKAAEGILDKICEAKTPKIDWDKQAKRHAELLERKLFKLSLETKQFGIDNISNLRNRIHGENFGDVTSWDLYHEVEELFARLDMNLSFQRHGGTEGEAFSVAVLSEEYPAITIVQIGPDETELLVDCMSQALSAVQYRLENEIQKMLEQRKERETEKRRERVERRSRGRRYRRH